MCLSCGAATLVQVVQAHTEEFLQEMNSKALVDILTAFHLIPFTVRSKICQSMNRKYANAHLFNHLKKYAAEVEVKEVFRMASQMTVCTNMSAFADKMIKTLQQGLY